MLLPSARVPPAPNTRSPCLFYSTSLVGRLPNEVWIHILECLPAPAILHCRQLCRKIKYIIDHTARLQYPIELFATGHVDGGPSNPLSTAARLAQLRAIDRGWRTLDWKSHLHYPWNGDCPNYELAGGVFARGRSTLPDAGQPDVDDFHHFTAAIDVIVFPPRDGERGEEVKSWSHEQVGLLVHDFTIAPEQDLVVLVGHRHEGAVEEPIPIHLRALSSNTPHPLATLPVLFAHPQPTDVFISDFTIQIYDSLLGILFWGAHAFHLMIWDWCSGEIIVDYAAPAGIHFDDFTFLSSSSFLIPSSSAAGAALRVYSFAHLLPPNHPSLSSAEHTSPSDTASDTTSKSSSDVSTPSPSRRHRINYDHIPLGRAPHHLEFDNSGRRVAPACWTPPRPDGVVRSFHIGNYVFSVSNLEDWRESAGSSRSGSEAGTSSSGVNGSGGSEGRGGSGHGGGGGGMASPAGLNGLSRRPQLCSLLKFPKPRREWNVGIMTCRVDPLPRFGMDQVRRCRSQGKGKARDDTPGETGTEEEEEEEGDETRLAPVRAFHADPDKAIIALSSGLVPVRTGVFAGVVYLDEGSLAWEEGGGDEGDADVGDEQPAGEPPVGEDLSPTQPEPVQPPPPLPTTATTSHPAPTSTHEPPPPLTTLVPWIDLHMPPSSLPAPADPPIMSVFDHSSAGSGHTPIQIQIHDAIIGEDGVPIGVAGGYPTEPAAPVTGQAGPSTGPGTAAGQAAAGVAPVQATGAAAGPTPQGAPAPGQTAPNSVLTGPDAPVPAPFTTALPFPAVPQVAEDDPNVDDMERLYFNLFVHCRALRRFAGEEEGSTGIGATLFEQAARPDEARADTSKPSGRIRPYRPKVYDWDDWAPPITRLLTRMPMPAWACISHGQRFATLGAGGAGMSDVGGTGAGAVVGGVAGIAGAGAGVNIPGPANANAILNPNIPDPNWLVDGGPGGTNVKRPVRVLDFNPYGVRRSKGKDVEGCRNRVTVVDEPSILPAGRYWQADVRSELPYREVVTREEMLLSGVMIDGERVLGMRSDERGNVSEMHVMQV